MNRSFRQEDRGARQRQRPLQMGNLRTSTMKEKEEELALFLDMRKKEKERNNLLLQNSDEFDAPLGPRSGSSPIFNIAATAPTAVPRKSAMEDFLNADNDKNDYDWLLTPPGTPLFPSLEKESPRKVMGQLETSTARPLVLKSRLANPQTDPAAKSNISSRQSASSPGLNTSSSGLRRPSSSGGSRPSTPTGRPSSSSASRSTVGSGPKPVGIPSSRPSSTAASTVKPTRSSTPNPRPTLSTSSKPTAPPRSSTPPARSTSRSSTPTTRATVPASKPTSRASTPTRRPSTTVSANPSGPLVRSSSVTSVSKPVSSTTAKNPAPPRSSSPTVKPRPWKPSDIPGFSLDAPPNLRTSLSDRPTSATRGRPGAPSTRSTSVEPASNGRLRRQSRSPSRGRPPNGNLHGSGGSVPAMNRLHVKANDNISPVLIGTKMVDRVMNMRKLAPPKQDDKHSPHSNLSAKSSSPDSSGFGRTLSKKSLDMAIRHMDIRRTIPGNLRPLMANIPASSMYSVRSGPPARRRTVSVSDSPLATSSNASSEVSVNNNALCVDVEVSEDVTSDHKAIRSPSTSLRGR